MKPIVLFLLLFSQLMVAQTLQEVKTLQLNKDKDGASNILFDNKTHDVYVLNGSYRKHPNTDFNVELYDQDFKLKKNIPIPGNFVEKKVYQYVQSAQDDKAIYFTIYTKHSIGTIQVFRMDKADYSFKTVSLDSDKNKFFYGYTLFANGTIIGIGSNSQTLLKFDFNTGKCTTLTITPTFAYKEYSYIKDQNGNVSEILLVNYPDKQGHPYAVLDPNTGNIIKSGFIEEKQGDYYLNNFLVSKTKDNSYNVYGVASLNSMVAGIVHGPLSGKKEIWKLEDFSNMGKALKGRALSTFEEKGRFPFGRSIGKLTMANAEGRVFLSLRIEAVQSTNHTSTSGMQTTETSNVHVVAVTLAFSTENKPAWSHCTSLLPAASNDLSGGTVTCELKFKAANNAVSPIYYLGESIFNMCVFDYEGNIKLSSIKDDFPNKDFKYGALEHWYDNYLILYNYHEKTYKKFEYKP